MAATKSAETINFHMEVTTSWIQITARLTPQEFAWLTHEGGLTQDDLTLRIPFALNSKRNEVELAADIARYRLRISKAFIEWQSSSLLMPEPS